MPKKARLNRIKAFQSYTIEEAAEVSGVLPRTIRNWAKNGLPTMDQRRPTLVRGDDLRAYILSQRKARESEGALDTIYCVKCKKQHRPAGNMADCIVKGNRASLTALCEVCETVISKPIAVALIPDIAQLLDLAITRLETAL